MARQSFSDAVRESPDRFVNYAFEINPNIKDFADFDDAFREKFDSKNGQNAKLDSEDIIVLFESQACKNKIRENVTDKEYEQLFGDGIIVKREPTTSKRKIVTIVSKKVTVKSHKWRGKEIKGATRTTPRKFSNAELKFLKVRKQKKVSTSKIIKEYEQHFGSKSPRTSSSLKSKVYRI